MCSDAYTYSRPITVGGPTGKYTIECPFSGDDYEWAVVNVATGSSSQLFISDDDTRGSAIPFDGKFTVSGNGQAPRNTLNGILINSSQVPALVWYRLSSATKNLYAYIDAQANSSAFFSVCFRFLPVRHIPARTVIVPDELEQQHNIARADKVVERLQLDIQKGDTIAGYGRLQ